MKLTVIGGGGVRAPLLVASALRRAEAIHLEELCLMDTNARKLKLIGGLCQQLAGWKGSPVRVVTTQDPRLALDGADYIITTIRVGGEGGRVLDERIALNLGVLGQETTGPGGFAMAMRSIPAILEYARLAEIYAPQAWLFNFTNPAGLVTQALREHGYERTVGICDGANLAQNDIARWLKLSPQQVRVEVFGLNHLSWARHAWVNERDVLPELLADEAFIAQSSLRVFEQALLGQFGLFLNEYLYYYYYAEKAVERILNETETRGEEVQRLNAALLEELESPEAQADPSQALHIYSAYEQRRSASYMHYARQASNPQEAVVDSELEQLETTLEDDEGYAGVALDIVAALETGEALYTALNLPDQGAIQGMQADDVVEVSSVVAEGTIRPLAVGPIPEPSLRLMQSVKLYERLAVQAITQRSTSLAVRALMAHPLVLSYSRATALVADYLQAHAGFIGEWK